VIINSGPVTPKNMYKLKSEKKKAHFLILSFLAFLPGFLSSFLVLVSISFFFLVRKKDGGGYLDTSHCSLSVAFSLQQL
jgi:hypothetical protein